MLLILSNAFQVKYDAFYAKDAVGNSHLQFDKSAGHGIMAVKDMNTTGGYIHGQDIF